MARPANRKEWLEKFLWLADRNRPAREFRTQLGIRIPDLSRLVGGIGGLRTELSEIYSKEAKELAKLETDKIVKAMQAQAKKDRKAKKDKKYKKEEWFSEDSE